MRVLLAALFVWGCMLGTAALVGSTFGDGAWPWWAGVLPATAMIVASALVLFLFNRAGQRPTLRPKPLAEHLAELEDQGLVVRTSFRAKRAFAVEEWEDEGSHYFIDLEDGRVLYLAGQYLYDYERIDDDPDLNQPRSFPCTEFEVLRHRDAGYVLDIRCAGSVLEPEMVAKPFTRADFQRGVPQDGEVITERSYEQLRRERATASCEDPPVK